LSANSPLACLIFIYAIDNYLRNFGLGGIDIRVWWPGMKTVFWQTALMAVVTAVLLFMVLAVLTA